MSNYFMYILFSNLLNKYYIGYSANIADRISKHNRAKKGFTARGKPWILMYSESFDNKASALAREKQLKKWKSKDQIDKLIRNNHGSEHPDAIGRVAGSNPAVPT